MKKGFEVLDISGDVGLRVYGQTLEEVFINGATGLYNLITDISQFAEKKSIAVKVFGESLDGLFIAWLNELIFQFDTYGFTGKAIEITSLDKNIVEASIRGEEFDSVRHERGLLVKAATYHDLKFEKKNDLWTAEVIFDI